MTVFARFWMAVITSISASAVGGISRPARLSLTVGVQGGICAGTSLVSVTYKESRESRTAVKASTSAGIHSPVGMPRGERVASQL